MGQLSGMRVISEEFENRILGVFKTIMYLSLSRRHKSVAFN